MSLADLDRVIETLSEAALSGAPARRSDLIHDALTLLRQMRENARLGTAWLDGDVPCMDGGARCEESKSWVFSPVCEHDPEPEVVRGAQFAALLILTPEDD